MTRTRAGQRRAVARGASFENDLNRLHALYAQQRRAVVVRCPPPTRAVHTPGGVRLVHVAEGPPDFLGVARDDRGLAVPVMLEAKACSTPRWPLANLPPHQAERLDAWARIGGVGAVLLRHGPSASCWVLPWKGRGLSLSDLWHRYNTVGQRSERAAPGEASIGEDDLYMLGLSFDRTGWLGPLLALTRQPSSVTSP